MSACSIITAPRTTHYSISARFPRSVPAWPRPAIGMAQPRRRRVPRRSHPRRTRARLALRRPARCVRGGDIEAVVAFQPLAIVLDLTARLEGVLGLGAGGKENAGASDGQYGAHGRIRADRVPACKTRVVKPVQAPRPRVARLAPRAAYRANSECAERSQAVGRTKGKAAPRTRKRKQRINASAFWRPGSRACRTVH